MIQSTDVKARDLPASPGGPSRRARLAVVGALAAAAFAIGLIIGASAGTDPGKKAAERFTTAWERGDYARMYALTDDGTKRRNTSSQFAARYRAAAETATASSIRFGRPRGEKDGVVKVPAVVSTRLWGPIRTTLRVPVTEDGDTAHVDWSGALLFPGLRPGEKLRRQTEMPTRGTLLARDKTVLATGSSRTSSSPIASTITGTVGPIPPERAERLRALGVPADAEVGSTGLERVFDERLIGKPGGTLLAGDRGLAHADPVQAAPVRTTISPKVQQAAVAALAGRYGGVAVLDPRTGEVLGAAGVAWSALQPPGSTFKIVTLTGALEQGLATPSTPFPVQTAATLEGVQLENANGESCGGTLAVSFAKSCNSVFAPLGAKLGASKLVDVAKRFGWNEDPGIAGASTPSIPAADQIGDDLAVGSSAIGQGRVQATALQMALVAATIGDRGRRPRPTLLFGQRRPAVRATSPRVARTVERLMRGVVAFGTGTSAAIPGVVVAGKTGTAELESTVKPQGTPPPEQGPTPPEKVPETDAWFAAIAPAAENRKPRAAVGVLLVRAGAGGDVAAPVARTVLASALQR